MTCNEAGCPWLDGFGIHNPGCDFRTDDRMTSELCEIHNVLKLSCEECLKDYHFAEIERLQAACREKDQEIELHRTHKDNVDVVLQQNRERIAELEATVDLFTRRLNSSEELRTGLHNLLQEKEATMERLESQLKTDQESFQTQMVICENYKTEVERLMRELAETQKARDINFGQWSIRKAENAKLRAALKEYANRENWELDNHSLARHAFWSKGWFQNHSYDEQPWKIAEAALREEKKP